MSAVFLKLLSLLLACVLYSLCTLFFNNRIYLLSSDGYVSCIFSYIELQILETLFDLCFVQDLMLNAGEEKVNRWKLANRPTSPRK